MIRLVASLAGLLLLLSGCMDASMLPIPSEIEERMDRTLDAILDKDTDYLVDALRQEGKSDEQLSTQLEELYGYMREGDVTDRPLVGRHWRSVATGGGSFTEYSDTYQIEYEGDLYASVFIQIRREDGRDYLYFFNYYQLEESYQDLNRFRLAGQSPVHYLILCLTVGTAILVLSTIAAIIIRWRKLRSPIKWLLFSLIGFGAISLDWTTGMISVSLLYIQILGAGFTKLTIYEPLVISFSIPLGAILFWFRATPKPLVAQEDTSGD